MTDPNQIADLLEAAGEDRAAGIVRAANTADLPDVKADAETPQTPEDTDRAAGEHILAQMKRQTPTHDWGEAA